MSNSPKNDKNAPINKLETTILQSAPKPFNDLAYGQHTLQSFGNNNILVDDSGDFWIWEQQYGVWRKIHHATIKKRIMLTCGLLSHRKVIASFKMAQILAHKENHNFNINNQGINVLNGTLQLKNGQWTLHEPDKHEYRTIQIPVQIDPTAQAPRFKKFLNEVFQGDEDANDKKQIVLELLGYSMLSTTKYEKWVLLIGKGANGKSILLTVVEAMIGACNISAVQPAEFGNRFQRAHLQGNKVWPSANLH